MPFAVSSSLEVHDVKGRKVRGREYPWGVVETENPDQSDLVKLRSLLVSHMQDMREVTHDVHYENYRSLRLAGGISPKISESSLRDNVSILSGNGVEESEKDRMLQEKEAELKRMQEMIAKMQEEIRLNAQILPESVPINGNGNA